MGPLENRQFKQVRSKLIQKAKGSVLELGSETGINFSFYTSVEKVVAIEPMLSKSKFTSIIEKAGA
ncbi:MAG: hypothetical protein Q8934_08445 [Bacillota bacterium]|nr:hypothetical protein [Bacillota bacterium]